MSKSFIPTLAIVIPCFNEEAVLPDTLARLSAFISERIALGMISDKSAIFAVDDGSQDRTWSLICNSVNPHVSGLHLQYNVGQQLALLAGIHALNGKVDCIITMDADLQDDMACIDDMLSHYQQGCELVYGVRAAREVDGFFKRITARLYYRVARYCGVSAVGDHADFRLLGKSVIAILAHFNGPNVVLRSVLPQLSVKSAQVFYDRQARGAGETKYSLQKMLLLAWAGISSESVKPLYAVLFACVGVFGLMSLFAFGLLLMWMLGGPVSIGGIILMAVLLLLSLQSVGMALMAAYLGNVYLEVRSRPHYSIGDQVNTLSVRACEREPSSSAGISA